MMTFANPWGLLALLGVPVVLAIHFLQRRSREFPVSTLFLLDAAARVVSRGRAFRRLLPSVPLWLQLLMVLLLSMVLAQPRWPWSNSVQRIAVVIDASASMRAFKPELADGLTRLANVTGSRANRTDWLVLPADTTHPRLYAGDSLDAAQQALAAWQPVGGPQDPGPALRLARERAGRDGLVVFATDTPVASLPADATLLAVGHAIPNVGITGLSIRGRDNQIQWSAMLANRAAHAQTRAWHLEWDGTNKSTPETIQLGAGQLAAIGGIIPAGAQRLRVVLTPDAFPPDDTFPFVVPAPRALTLRNLLPPRMAWLDTRLCRALPALAQAPAASPADLTLAGTVDGIFPKLGHAIQLNLAGDPGAKFLAEPIVAARHPLTDGLSWDALAVQEFPPLPAKPGDTPLVWSGDRVLVSMREIPREPSDADGPAFRQLTLHFNPLHSNFDRLPAAAVLLFRFVESLRIDTPGTARVQVEPGQSLAPLLPTIAGALTMESLAQDGTLIGTREIMAHECPALRAPDLPGYFRLRGGHTIWLEAAVAFADTRESDFSACASAFPDISSAGTAGTRDATTDRWSPVWILGLLAALLVSWRLLARE